eukprot:2878308-Pleurochrysis_carterae.AAC.2
MVQKRKGGQEVQRTVTVEKGQEKPNGKEQWARFCGRRIMPLKQGGARIVIHECSIRVSCLAKTLVQMVMRTPQPPFTPDKSTISKFVYRHAQVPTIIKIRLCDAKILEI